MILNTNVSSSTEILGQTLIEDAQLSNLEYAYFSIIVEMKMQS